MKKSAYLLSSLTLILLLLTGCTEKDDFPVFGGPYLGQSPPGNNPQLFMPGLISTNYIDHCIGFLKEGRVCVFSIWEKGTYYLYEKDGRWTQPEKVPWQNEQGATMDFTAGPDGSTIYFQSRRPTSPDDKERETNIWKVEWTGNGWTEPVPLSSPANTEEFSEAYPSVTPDGSVYFFTGSRPDSGIGDIYRSKFVDGKYLEAEHLPPPINSDYYEVDPFVAPDGSYLLFGSDRPGGYGLMDLYVSFRREDGSWTPPFNTGPELNPFCIPTRMSITPDGKYFFFPSNQETDAPKGEDFVSSNIEKWGDYDVYWVDTSFINDLMDQYMGKKSAAEMIVLEYQEQGILSATAMLSELYNTTQDSLYFELSEFMVFCGDLMTAGKSEESEQLYIALLKSIPEEFRIKQGYAITCILNVQVPKGLDLIREMWTQFPSEKSEDMYIITFQLRKESRKEDELAVLRFITLEFPDSGIAHFWLADAFEHYGNIEEAFKYCTRALELKPDFEDAVEMRKRLEDDFPVLQGPYLGQKPPGMTPEVFAAGIISKPDYHEHSSLSFAKDGEEIYWSAQCLYEGESNQRIFFMKLKDGRWTSPKILDFTKKYHGGGPVFSPDEKKLYFYSCRPKSFKERFDNLHIWYVDKINSGWGEPEKVEKPINSVMSESNPCFTNEGTMYFDSKREGGRGGSDIYRSVSINGQFMKPENIGDAINTKDTEYAPCIAPDESYIIFSRYTESPKGVQLYISFRKSGGLWTEAIKMSKRNKLFGKARFPGLSPDGKYLFFCGYKNQDVEIYWVDAKIIYELKPDDLK